MKTLPIFMALVCLTKCIQSLKLLDHSEKRMETQWRLEKELDEIYALAKIHIKENLNKLSSVSAIDIVQELVNSNGTVVEPTYTTCPRIPNANGIYKVKIPGHQEPFPVYCDSKLAGHGWTVIARRSNDSLNFFSNWKEYKEGFGNLSGDFFIGLDKLHAITKSEVHELYIHLEDFEGETSYAQYDEFLIESEKNFYALTNLGRYTGDAGDSLNQQVGMKFTTYDQDNDMSKNENCAIKYMGPWWHKNCTKSHLFGLYLGGEYKGDFGQNGMIWNDWRGMNYSYKTMQMMVRPKCTC